MRTGACATCHVHGCLCWVEYCGPAYPSSRQFSLTPRRCHKRVRDDSGSPAATSRDKTLRVSRRRRCCGDDGRGISTLNARLTTQGLADIHGALGLGFDGGSWISTIFSAAQMVVTPAAAWMGTVLSTRRVLLWTGEIFAASAPRD